MYSPNQIIDQKKQKLAKVLAQAGVASRRKAEELIKNGRVCVNGVLELNVATRVTVGEDLISVDGKLLPSLQQPQRTIVLALHKPAGYVSTVSDPDGKPTVMNFIPKEYLQYRLYPVGRLDEESEGLILLTNDGDLAYRMTHPKFEVPKKYLVWIKGRVTTPEIERLREGVWLKEQGKNKRTQPAEVEILAESYTHFHETQDEYDSDPATQGKLHLKVKAEEEFRYRPDLDAEGNEVVANGKEVAADSNEVAADSNEMAADSNEVAADNSNNHDQVLSVIITEGLHRQVRRMFRAINHEVVRLKRVNFGKYELGNLKPGKIRIEQDTTHKQVTHHE
jgi:pseudouridine synthase